MKTAILLFVILFLLLLCSCKPEDHSSLEDNRKDKLLTNYVKSPLDKAESVVADINKRNDEILSQD